MGNDELSSIAAWRITLGAGLVLTDAGARARIPRARKSRGLLAYLSLKPGHAGSRREIVDLLWSDRGPDQGRASLRQCLFELKAEAPGLVVASGDTIALAPGVAIVGNANPTLEELADLDPAFERWRGALANGRAAPGERRHRAWYWALGPAAMLMAAIGWWTLRDRPERFVPDVAIMTGGMASGVARAFSDAANAAMPGRYLHVRTVSGAPGHADWIVSAGRPEAGGMIARIITGGGQELWTERLPVAEDDDKIGAELGRRVGETMLCATRAPDGPASELQLLTLVMDVCGKLARRDDTADSRIAAQRLTAAYRDYAYGHGLLAMNLSYVPVPPALADGTAREVDEEARRALALDPRTGEAWMALANEARKRRQYAEAERLLRRGIEAQPDHGSLNNFLASVLAAVGRTDEALVFARRAAALDPASPIKLATVASLLAQTGRPRAALALLDQAEQERGATRVFDRTRLEILEQTGDIDEAQALIGRHRGASAGFEPVEEQNIRGLLAAMRARSRIAPDLQARVAIDSGGAAALIRALVHVGQTADAIALARSGRMYPADLFGAELAPLWRDRSFPKIAETLQLWRYWSVTGRWPDICADRALTWRCGIGVKSASAPH